MDFEQTVAGINAQLLSQVNRGLSDLEVELLRGAWENLTYEEVAEASGYSLNYLQRDIGPKFWKLLSQTYGCKVNKTNARAVLTRKVAAIAANSPTLSPVASATQNPQSVFHISGITGTPPPVKSSSSADLACQNLPGLEPTMVTARSPRIDWGEAPDVHTFYGRQSDLETLKQWILADRCRLVALLGMGGIGKSALAAKVVKVLQSEFELVIWRSLRNAPTLETLLSDLVAFLSQETDAGNSPERLLTWLKNHRCLIVLDNLETVMQAGDRAGYYQADYDNYGDLLQLLGETLHQSCVILTSREKPVEVSFVESETGSVRSYVLSGCRETALALIAARGLGGSETEQQQLCDLYGCSPLALKIVTASIQTLFGRDIAAFFAEETTIFNGIRRLLEQQFERLSELEKVVMFWLAINREWTDASTLQADILPLVSRMSLLEALESLAWRSLIEQQAGKYTQQPVVMEYVLSNFVEQVITELETLQLDLFLRYPLLKTTVKDYIRESQSRLIVQPVSQKLAVSFSSLAALEQQILRILTELRRSETTLSGYGCGNLLNLCRHLKFDLSGYDFSNLTIRHGYFQGAALQRINFQHANFVETVFTNLLGGVLSVAVSPDGELIATGDSNGDVHIWHTADGQLLQTLTGHTDWVRALQFSRDSCVLVSGSDDQTIRLWDIRPWCRDRVRLGEATSPLSGQCLKVLSGNTSHAWSIAFSQDETLLASGSDDGTVWLWDVATGQPTRILQGASQQLILSVAFSPHPDFPFLLAGGSGDTSITVWNAQTGEAVNRLMGHTDRVTAVVFSPDGTLLASASDDHTIKIWQMPSGQCLKTLQGHTDWVTTLHFSPDGTLLASAGRDTSIRLWEVATGQCRQILKGHTLTIHQLSFVPKPEGAIAPAPATATDWLLVSGSDDQTIRLWSTLEGYCLRVIQGHTQKIWSAALHPQKNWLITSGDEKLLRLWDLDAGRELPPFIGHGARVESVAFSPDGRLVASGGEDTTVRLWDVETRQCLKVLHDDSAKHTWCVTFSPDGTLIAASNEDQLVRIWDVATGQLLQRLQGHTNWTWAISFSPDGSQLASTSYDQTVKLWQVADGTCSKTLLGHENSVLSGQFAPNGQWLATGDYSGVIRLWHGQTGECLYTWQAHDGTAAIALSFSADSQWLISGGMDNLAKIWNLKGQLQAVLEGHTHMVFSVLFTSDQQQVITAGWDETIKIWDANTGKCLQTLRSDRPYEGMNITEATGITDAQRLSLKTLGAIGR